MRKWKREELRKLGVMTPEELKDQEQRMKAIEEAAVKDVAKYFDRINDKLFSYNNMLIAGYFALVALSKLHYLYLLIPVVNLGTLIAVDWYMMEYKRIESTADSNTTAKNRMAGKKSNRATLLTLFTMLTTAVVTYFFITFLSENNLCFK